MSSKTRKSGRPPVLLRLPLRVLSLAVSILLVVSLLATALLLDLRILTSSDSLSTILTEVSSLTTQSPTEPAAQVNPYAVRLSDGDLPDSIPSDVLSGNGIAAYLQDFLNQALGTNVAADLGTIEKFLAESTVIDYFSEKVIDYAQDFINGTENALITTEELMDLLEENQPLIEETFQIEITEEMKADIQVQIKQVVEEEDLNGTIRQSVNEAMEQTVVIPGLGEMTVSALLEKIYSLTQTKYLALAAGLCLALMVALLLLSFYNLPAGLRRCGKACLAVGSPLAVILLVIQLGGKLLTTMLGQEQQLISTVQAATAPLAPIHYGLPLVGLALVVFARLWRTFLPRNED